MTKDQIADKIFEVATLLEEEPNQTRRIVSARQLLAELQHKILAQPGPITAE